MEVQAWYEAPIYSADVLDGILALVPMPSVGYRVWRETDIALLQWLYQRAAFSTMGLGENLGPPHLPDSVPIGTPDSPQHQLLYNGVTTLLSWLFAEKPRILVHGTDATAQQAQAIQQRSTALDATQNTPEAHGVLSKVLADGLLYGCGYLWPRIRNGKIRFQRLAWTQVYYDPTDARDGEPSFVHVRELVPRRALLAWYKRLGSVMDLPAHDRRAKAIKEALPVQPVPQIGQGVSPAIAPYDWMLSQAGAREAVERVEVIHTWLTATAPGEPDGRYVCALLDRGNRQTEGGVVLVDQEYARTTLPVCRFVPIPHTEGVDGFGFGHLWLPYQRPLDLVQRRIAEVMYRLGKHNVMVSEAAFKNLEGFTDPSIAVLRGNEPEAAPVVIPPSPVTEHDHAYADRLKFEAFADNGISMAAVTGGTQLGAGASGIAQVEERQTASMRLGSVQEAGDMFFLAVAQETLHVIQEGIHWDPAFAATWGNGSEYRETAWKELLGDYPEGSWKCSLQPSGMLGRGDNLAIVLELSTRGLLPPEVTRQLLMDDPDLRRASRLVNAHTRWIELCLDMLRTEDADAWARCWPTKDMDLPAAIELAGRYIADSYADRHGDDVIQRLQEFKLRAQGLLQEMAPPAAVDPTAAMAPPAPALQPDIGSGPDMAPSMAPL